MKAVTAPSPPAQRPEHPSWSDRSGRLYEELRRPARAMLRRAFGSAFSDEEIEDLYGNAWLGTLRALERRHEGLDDEEIRKYLLTAVANHASKELRRRKRRPTAPLDKAWAVADGSAEPDERAAGNEQSQITRDLLGTLPPRRRAVMLLRYGWGLDPSQVCGLVKGLSPRAYRKEITRGVDELTEKLRLVERGEWCADREPVLKAYAAGLADAEERRQAKHHLSHCRPCTEFVGRLSGHLHDIGGSVALSGAVDRIDDGRLSLLGRAGELFHRLRDGLTGRAVASTDGSQDAASTATGTAATARGAGAAGSGVLAKLAGFGTGGKVLAACLGGGAAATVCVAAGVAPIHLGPGDPHPAAPAAQVRHHAGLPVAPGRPTPASLYAEAGHVAATADPSASQATSTQSADATPAQTADSTTTTSTTEAAPAPPPDEEQFGLAPTTTTATSTSGSTSTGTTTDSSGTTKKSPSGASQFGP